MLSFYEFNCLIEDAKKNEAIQSFDDVLAKLGGKKQVAKVEPPQPQVPTTPQSAVDTDDMAAKIAALKNAQGALADKMANQTSRPTQGNVSSNTPAAPKVTTTGDRDVNDPRRKGYRLGIKRPHGEKNFSNQMDDVSTSNKDKARAAKKMDDITQFNQILMSPGGEQGGGEKFRYYAREALKTMGINAPEDAPFQLVPMAQGKEGEIVIPDPDAIKEIISSTWKKLSSDYDTDDNRIEKEEMPERMADFHAKLSAGVYNGYTTEEVHRAYQFLSSFKDASLWGKTMTIDQLANKLSELPNKGGLQVPTPEQNRRALDLMIDTDMSGQYRMFTIKGDPKDGNSKIAVNGYPGSAWDDEEADSLEPVGSIPGKLNPGVSMKELPGRSNKKALGRAVPDELKAADQLALALGITPEQRRRKRQESAKPSGDLVNEEAGWISFYSLVEYYGSNVVKEHQSWQDIEQQQNRDIDNFAQSTDHVKIMQELQKEYEKIYGSRDVAKIHQLATQQYQNYAKLIKLGQTPEFALNYLKERIYKMKLNHQQPVKI